MKYLKNTARYRAYRLPRRSKPSKSAAAPAGPRLLLLGAATLGALAATWGDAGTAQSAPKLTVLFAFTNLKGAYPTTGLIADAAGNLYGTTASGGARQGVGLRTHAARRGRNALDRSGARDIRWYERRLPGGGSDGGQRGQSLWDDECGRDQPRL